MRKIASLFLLSFLALASPLKADEASEKVFAEKIKSSVGLLYSQDASGTMHMHCTATIFNKVKNGYQFVTAAHCVGSDKVDKEASANPNTTPFYITFDEVGKPKEFYPAKPKFVGYQSRGEDFAVFEVNSSAEWPIIPIGDEKKIKDGAQYWNVASPLGLGLQTFEGIISSIYLDRPLIEGDINWKGTLVLQQAGVNGGSSGSALISKETHQIVGFLVGTVGGSTIIAIPVSRFVAVSKAVEQGKYKYWKVVEDLNPDGTPKE